MLNYKMNNLGLKRSFKKTAENVEMSRFIGKWYEVARIPFGVESREKFNVTVEFFQDEDSIFIKNTEQIIFPDGIVKEIISTGRATKRDQKDKIKKKYSDSQLQVLYNYKDAQQIEFNILFVAGGEIPMPYQCAAIGTQRNLWILSRKKRISENVLKAIESFLEKKYNYNFDNLKMTPFY